MSTRREEPRALTMGGTLLLGLPRARPAPHAASLLPRVPRALREHIASAAGLRRFGHAQGLQVS